jgi:hypothetical protein
LFWRFFENDLRIKNISVHTSTPEYVSTADTSTTLASPWLWFSHIGLHNSTPEYSSTIDIHTQPVHSISFEKKFLKKWFLSSKYHQNPQVLKRRSIEKREREREEEKVLKKGREKLQKSLQIKGEVNILEGGKYFNHENPFCMIPFSPPPSYHFENLF